MTRSDFWPGDTVVRMRGRGRSFGTRRWHVVEVDERYNVLHLEAVTDKGNKLRTIISPSFCKVVNHE